MLRLRIVAAWAVFAMFPGCLHSLAQETAHEPYVSPWKTPWDYEGARGTEHWSQLDPQYVACNAGTQQSPIDIHDAANADLPVLRFEWKSGPLRYVINNRHTIRVNYRSGNGNLLSLGDQRYELTQFHFHHPSEEQVNGRSAEMEVHLMYQSTRGDVAGVTVFVERGRANSTVETVWEHMPKTEGHEEVSGIVMSPAALVPEKTDGHYMYKGSLTAPPCTEGVTWFVLKRSIEMSSEQIDAFARLYPHNVRPLQPLNGRIVEESR